MQLKMATSNRVPPLSLAGVIVIGVWAALSFVRGLGDEPYSNGFFSFFFYGYLDTEGILFVDLPWVVLKFLFVDALFGRAGVEFLLLAGTLACVLALTTRKRVLRFVVVGFGGLQLFLFVISTYGVYGRVVEGNEFVRFDVTLRIVLLAIVGAGLIVVGELPMRNKSAPLPDLAYQTNIGDSREGLSESLGSNNRTFCGQCGVENPRTANFCNSCGFALPK